MPRIWFSSELETVATWWRLLRTDGVTLGFTTHDADLWFDGIVHRAAPGMVPSAIRRTADFQPDSAEVQGAISHEAIAAADLDAGRFDGAEVVIGLVDWSSLEHQTIYRGSCGAVTAEATGFTAELQSRKAELQRDPVPRTSPYCRARFCGPGCGLSAALHEAEAVVTAHDSATGHLTLNSAMPLADMVGGELAWLDGPYAGIRFGVALTDAAGLILAQPTDTPIPAGSRATIRQGCDHTLATCASRFTNALNFRGEPFLPGNDLVIRYGLAQ